MQGHGIKLKKKGGKKIKRLKSKERNALTSRMEWYFDEITDRKYIRCPSTGRKATIEVIRSASRDHSPFVDIAYCSIFGCAPTCKKQCLKRINYMKHFHE